MSTKYDALVEHLTEIENIRGSVAVLGWDQQTQMPPGGAAARARQLATLSRISHELFIGAKTHDLLEGAAAELGNADYDSDAASMVRVVKEDYEVATRIPAEFVAQWIKETTLAHEVWVKARQESDFSIFAPVLEKIIDMARQRAEYIGYDDHPYDALLGEYERGIKSAQVKQIFESHRPALVALIAAISENADKVDDSILHQNFEVDKQREFALTMVKKFGYDMQRGVQAVAVHPFATSFSIDDVRITTRFNDDFLNPALFGMMHEAGHAMYEQGISHALEGTPLADGTSLGVHESQSRLWENVVGRSKGFWSWALPQLKTTFPDQFGHVNLDTFYKAINRVQPSFIRVEADEATYNLHIMVRFEIELAILNGELNVKDIPDAWNSKFEEYLGLVPPNDALGVLQDVHWSAGLMGYFATYALGNLLSMQYYNKAVQDHPTIPDEIASGKFDTLRKWLNANIHTHGRKFTSDELTHRVTGSSISADAYIAYLQNKFGEIYEL